MSRTMLRTTLSTIPLWMMLAVCAGASAQGMYRCTIDGKVNYSSTPCKEGTMKAIPVPPAPKADPQRVDTLRRQQEALAALQQARAEREAKEQKAEVISLTSARAERCDKLRAEKLQAEDNATKGPGPLRAGLRYKAEQLAATVAAECGS
jgi:hypothetical protein